MRKWMLVLIATLWVVSVPAKAGDLFVGGSFPLVGQILGSQKTTEVHAGPNLLVSTSDAPEGADKAVWTGGYVSFPANTNGVFPEFNFLRVTTLALGIDPKYVKEHRVRSDDPSVAVSDDGTVTVDTRTLQPGQHYIVRSVRQNASRKDTRILWIRFGKNISKWDEVAMVFMVTDPTKFVDDYLRLTGGTTLREASDDQVNLAKDLYLKKEAGSFQLVSPSVPHDIRIDSAFREAQGAPRVLDPPVKLEPIVETRKVALPEGPVTFTINFVKDGNAFFKSGMRVRIGEKSFNLTNASPTFVFPSDQYQFRFYIPGRGDSGWSTIKVWSGMGPVTVKMRS